VFFDVIPAGTSAPPAVDRCFLQVNNWDDFGFKTMFGLYYRDRAGTIRYIGDVKIGQAGLGRDESRPEVPAEFDRLGNDLFSLGQDASYYQRINELSDQTAEEILRSLNDVAFDLDLFDRALRHKVTGVALWE
jgi:hypothetical protein